MKLLALLLSFTLLSACATFGSKKESSVLPVISEKPPLTKVWANRTTKGTKDSYLRLAPVVTADKVFSANSKGTLVASDRNSGKVLWELETKKRISSGPVYSSGTVIVGTSNASVLAYDANNGELLWEASVSNEVLATPAVADDKVFVKTVDGMLYAFDVKLGELIWVYEHGAPSLILRASSSPVVVDDLVVAGFSDGKLSVLNVETGRLVWQRTITAPRGLTAVDRMVDIDADPIVADGVIYVGSYQGNLSAIGLRTGELFWRHKISSFKDLSVGSNYLFLTDHEGVIWAFMRDNGQVAWKQEKLVGRGITASKVVAGRLIVGDKFGYLHWLDISNGKIESYSKVTKSAILTAPTVAGSNLYISSRKGVLTALARDVRN